MVCVAGADRFHMASTPTNPPSSPKSMRLGVTGSIKDPEDLPIDPLVTGSTKVFIMVSEVVSDGRRLNGEDIGYEAKIKALRVYDVPDDKLADIQKMLGIQLF